MKGFILETAVAAIAIVLLINSAVVAKHYASPKRGHTDRNPRIIEGKYAKNGQFPYQVSLLVHGQSNCTAVERTCGGSIIAENWILTSAYCVSPGPLFEDVFFIYVGAGSVYYDKPSQTDIFNSSSVYPHPDFNGETLENDIALLKAWGFDFNKYVRPIPLVEADAESPSSGQLVIVSGFGQFINEGPISKKLLYSKLAVVDCASGAPSTSFCAVDSNTPVSAICDGDAGGAAALYTDGELVLVGVISYSDEEKCDNGPQGFTRVSPYVGWITETMANN